MPVEFFLSVQFLCNRILRHNKRSLNYPTKTGINKQNVFQYLLFFCAAIALIKAGLNYCSAG